MNNSNNVVISQEEPSDFQGYMGYVGSTFESSATYAQEVPNTFNPIYGQQIFGVGSSYSQGFAYPTLQVIFYHFKEIYEKKHLPIFSLLLQFMLLKILEDLLQLQA